MTRLMSLTIPETMEIETFDADRVRALYVDASTREQLDPFDIAKAIAHHVLIRNLTLGRVAQLFGIPSVGTCATYLRLFKLHPDVRALMSPVLPREQKLGLSYAYIIAALPLDKQLSAAKNLIRDNRYNKKKVSSGRRTTRPTGE